MTLPVMPSLMSYPSSGLIFIPSQRRGRQTISPHRVRGTCMKPVGYALSIKQPWAALLVHGHKTIEVRRWPTARRGTILIHAARVPDERPEAWRRVPAELSEA